MAASSLKHAIFFLCYQIIFVKCIDDGGWFTNQADVISTSGTCNIDVLDSLNFETFLSKYAYTAPVILKDISDNSVFRELCRKNKLLEMYGNKVIRLSTANTYSYEKVDVPLEVYVNNLMKPQSLQTLGNETRYFFGDNDHREWMGLFNEYQQPPYSLPQTSGTLSFGLAGPGTGVPFHWHGPGFGEVIYGRKHWFLYPPDSKPTFDPDKSTLYWYVNEYPNLKEQDKPMECTIGPNEVIYFPDRWWHSTLNLDSSVFISTFLAPNILSTSKTHYDDEF